jgi:hypothetical protein
MRIGTVASAAFLTLVGCAPRAPAGRITPPTPASAHSGAVLATPSSDMPPPLSRPGNIACILTADLWPMEDLEDLERGRQFLRFEAGGPPFAEMFGGTNVELAVPAALASAGAMLNVYSNGVFVSGHLEAAEIPIYPAVPFVMSGVFVPNYDRRLIWRSAKPGFITVVTEPIPRLLPVDGALSAERPCKDIALGAVVFKDGVIDKAIGTKVGPVERPPPWPWLRSGQIRLSAEPDGPLIAEIDVVEPRDDTMLIHPPRVLAVKKGWTRIALRTYGGVVFGWVPSDQIVKSKKEYVDLSHDARMIRIFKGLADGNFVACDHDIPLVAEVAGDRRLVGTVRARVPFQPEPAKAGWISVVFRDAGIARVAGASFLLRETELHGCSPAPPRPPPKRP